ncbi:MAG: ectoine synthase [Planctomycetes bacterium]|nr:ectoine synthase [Planctomycetota bacterium]NUQ34102.1 ectoine synthase [Planctomycetaceae bacterium]
MIVRSLDDVLGTEHEVKQDGWTSRRLLLRKHGMGFSLHDTLVHAGACLEMRYANHLEAVYCVEGRGSITHVDSGENYAIVPGTVYALDAHDRHILRAETQMRMVCVFNPPVSGAEVHDATGAYPLVNEVQG